MSDIKIKCKALDTVGSSLEVCNENNVVGMVPLSLIADIIRDDDGCIEALVIPKWLATDRGFIACNKPKVTDDDIRAMWINAGGTFHGPITETATMTEERIIKFIRGLL